MRNEEPEDLEKVSKILKDNGLGQGQIIYNVEEKIWKAGKVNAIDDVSGTLVLESGFVGVFGGNAASGSAALTTAASGRYPGRRAACIGASDFELAQKRAVETIVGREAECEQLVLDHAITPMPGGCHTVMPKCHIVRED
jgi:hypothetical protein